jgi:hypothetical protein
VIESGRDRTSYCVVVALRIGLLSKVLEVAIACPARNSGCPVAFGRPRLSKPIRPETISPATALPAPSSTSAFLLVWITRPHPSESATVSLASGLCNLTLAHGGRVGAAAGSGCW